MSGNLLKRFAVADATGRNLAPTQIATGLTLLVFGGYLAWLDLGNPVIAFSVYGLAFFLFRQLGSAWLTLIPTAIVAGHTYPFTGSLLVSPADYISVAAVACVVMRCRTLPHDRPLIAVLLAMAVVMAIAAIRGWVDLPASPLRQQLDLYLTRLNAAYVFKGYAVGTLLAIAFLLEWRESSELAWKRLRDGIRWSALAVAVVVIYERSLGFGVFDFANTFRASGPIFSMHIGGQHIDCFWALVLPFLLFAREPKPTLARAFVGTAIQILSIYAIFVTMSRALIALAAVLLSLAIVMNGLSRMSSRSARLFSAVSGVILLALLATMWGAGDAVENRFKSLRADFGTRVDHLRQLAPVVAQANPVWGAGLGVYPSLYRQHIGRSESLLRFQPATEDRAAGLRMNPGTEIYLEQLVDVARPSPWKIEIKYSSLSPSDSDPDSRLKMRVTVCEKTLLQSYNCVPWNPDVAEIITGEQEVSTGQIDLSELTENHRGFPRRPTSLTLGASEPILVHSIGIRDANDEPVLKNEDFANSSSRWYFTSDDHLAWRTKNAWAHVRVESGWLGIISWITLLGLVTWRLANRFFKMLVGANGATSLLERQRIIVGATVLGGWLVMSAFGTLADTAWILQCLLLLLAAVAVRPCETAAATK